MNPIFYGKQNIDQEDIEGVVETLTSNFLTQGPKVEMFEKAFSSYCGSRYALACANGTAALHLSVLALNLEAGDKVLSTPLTFAASTNCILYAGGRVEFIDINEADLLLDLDLLERKCEENPGEYKGVIVVDFAGVPIDIRRLRKIADKHGFWIIEDACHAPGGKRIYQDAEEKVGNGCFSDLTVFSFHPVKHIACGEGGMITTNSEILYKKLKKLRAHGIEKDPSLLNKTDEPSWYHEMQELGYNYRLSDINASLGITQLKKLDSNIERRASIALKYSKMLSGVGDLILPLEDEGFKNAFHLYVIRTKKRNELYEFLKNEKIFCQVHYIPVYLHPFYQQNGYRNVKCDVMEKVYSECLSLPIYPTLEEPDQERVVACIIRFFNQRD